jgi:hypothetical protein
MGNFTANRGLVLKGIHDRPNGPGPSAGRTEAAHVAGVALGAVGDEGIARRIAHGRSSGVERLQHRARVPPATGAAANIMPQKV